MHGGQTLVEESMRMSSILTASKTVHLPVLRLFVNRLYEFSFVLYLVFEKLSFLMLYLLCVCFRVL